MFHQGSVREFMIRALDYMSGLQVQGAEGAWGGEAWSHGRISPLKLAVTEAAWPCGRAQILWLVSPWLESWTNHPLSLSLGTSLLLSGPPFCCLLKGHAFTCPTIAVRGQKESYPFSVSPCPVSLLREVVLYCYPRKSRVEWSDCFLLLPTWQATAP